MQINFTNKTKYNTKLYRDTIKKVFEKIISDSYFNIIFVTKRKIKEINRDYRNIDKVTDVITFSLHENKAELFNEAEFELGDVFICIDRALEQANSYGHSIEREMGFLAVHGYLHLLGYDHQTKEEETEMFALQEEILNKAGLERR